MGLEPDFKLSSTRAFCVSVGQAGFLAVGGESGPVRCEVCGAGSLARPSPGEHSAQQDEHPGGGGSGPSAVPGVGSAVTAAPSPGAVPRPPENLAFRGASPSPSSGRNPHGVAVGLLRPRGRSQCPSGHLPGACRAPWDVSSRSTWLL